ncbi:MAG: DUF2007 domain-containing protein [Pseudomonadota bacterium]
MEELLRTNDPVLISFASVLLKEQNILFRVVDEHMSVLDGSLGILPRRILVDGDQLAVARKLVNDAGLGDELPIETDTAG